MNGEGYKSKSSLFIDTFKGTAYSKYEMELIFSEVIDRKLLFSVRLPKFRNKEPIYVQLAKF